MSDCVITPSYYILFIYLFIYLFKLHITPNSSNYNTKACKHKKKNTKKHKHNKYVNVGEMSDRHGSNLNK
jgi:uncharacterized membrane protein